MANPLAGILSPTKNPDDFLAMILGQGGNPAENKPASAKEIADNAGAVMTKRLPANTDLVGLSSDLITNQRSKQDALLGEQIHTALLTSVAQQNKLDATATPLIDNANTLADKKGAVANDITKIEGDNSAENFARKYADELKIHAVNETVAKQFDSANTSLTNIMGQVTDQFATIKKAESMGILDMLTSPIEFVKAKFAAEQATTQLNTNMQQVKAIDTITAAQAQDYQARVVVYNNDRALATQSNFGRDIQINDLTTTKNLINNANDINVDHLKSLTAAYKFNNDSLEAMVKTLQARKAQGEIGYVDLLHIATAQQLEQQALTGRKLLEGIVEDEKSTDYWNNRFTTVREAMNSNAPELQSLSAFKKAVTDKTISPEQQVLVQRILADGFGGHAITASANPTETFNATLQYAPDSITPAMRDWITTIGQQRDASGVKVDDTPEAKEETFRLTEARIKNGQPAGDTAPINARNAYIKSSLKTAETNFDVYTNAKFTKILSPNSMNIESIAAEFGIPAVMIPELKKLRLNTTDFNSWAKDAVSQLAVTTPDNADLTPWSNAMAGLASYFKQDAEGKSGLAIKNMYVPSLMVPGTSTHLEATNPNSWRSAVLAEKTLRAVNAVEVMNRIGKPSYAP